MDDKEVQDAYFNAREAVRAAISSASDHQCHGFILHAIVRVCAGGLPWMAMTREQQMMLRRAIRCVGDSVCGESGATAASRGMLAEFSKWHGLVQQTAYLATIDRSSTEILNGMLAIESALRFLAFGQRDAVISVSQVLFDLRLADESSVEIAAFSCSTIQQSMLRGIAHEEHVQRSWFPQATANPTAAVVEGTPSGEAQRKSSATKDRGRRKLR